MEQVSGDKDEPGGKQSKSPNDLYSKMDINTYYSPATGYQRS